MLQLQTTGQGTVSSAVLQLHTCTGSNPARCELMLFGLALPPTQ